MQTIGFFGAKKGFFRMQLTGEFPAVNNVVYGELGLAEGGFSNVRLTTRTYAHGQTEPLRRAVEGRNGSKMR
jgi:hypothetical protein